MMVQFLHLSFFMLLQTGTLVHSFHGNGAIFEVQWSPRGDKLAACFSDNTVSSSIYFCFSTSTCFD